jgi:glycosyltransferase involved in cell wall biosynthesis
MLRSVASGTTLPHELIIVDGGQKPVDFIAKEFPSLHIYYLRCVPPSATKQRNLGIQSASPSSKLLGFFDDDIVIQPNALERMLAFWERADANLGGAAFNLINHPQKAAQALKSRKVIERLGLYSATPGLVMPSGFQTMIGRVDQTIYVQWLASGASVYRREVFSKNLFDEWFEGYSYLEDLDFSYAIGKTYDMAVVAEAGYFHYPGPEGRGNGIAFGSREIINRIYFVKKNPELSLANCYLGLIVRLALSLILASRTFKTYDWQRVWGNLLGLATLLLGQRPADAK